MQTEDRWRQSPDPLVVVLTPDHQGRGCQTTFAPGQQRPRRPCATTGEQSPAPAPRQQYRRGVAQGEPAVGTSSEEAPGHSLHGSIFQVFDNLL